MTDRQSGPKSRYMLQALKMARDAFTGLSDDLPHVKAVRDAILKSELSQGSDRDRLIHILVVQFDMFRNKAEEAADLFLHDKTLALPAQIAWECKDYGDGWVRYENLEDALAYQSETGCIIRPARGPS